MWCWHWVYSRLADSYSGLLDRVVCAGLLLASPQWCADPQTAKALADSGYSSYRDCAKRQASAKETSTKSVGSVVLKTASLIETVAGAALIERFSSDGFEEDVDGCNIVWKRILGGRYTLMMVTPTEEITRAI